MKIIDIRSDTVTLPRKEMLAYVDQNYDMLGDDVYGEDNLVNELEEKASKMFKKEAALLTTSGTQGKGDPELCTRFRKEREGRDRDQVSSRSTVSGHPRCSQGGPVPSGAETL